jgi:hypothetical protein
MSLLSPRSSTQLKKDTQEKNLNSHYDGEEVELNVS